MFKAVGVLDQRSFVKIPKYAEARMEATLEKRAVEQNSGMEESLFTLLRAIIVELPEFIQAKRNVFPTIRHMVRITRVPYNKLREDAKEAKRAQSQLR